MTAVVGAALTAAAPASAGTSTNQNSCKFNLDQVWRESQVELTGVASPNPAAPASGVTLTQSSARLRLPDYIAEAGYNLQFFKAGENQIPAKVWLAVEAPGTTQGVQVQHFDAVARLTITDDGNGTFVSSTPIDATVALPDTTWTAPASAFSFRQAGPGSLPPVPAGLGGASVQPAGSVLIRAEVGGVGVLLDCQPARGEGRAAPTPLTPSPFETVGVQAGAPVRFPAPKAVPAVAVRTTKLKATARSVKVALSCTAADCKGAVTLKAGASSLAAKKSYTLEAGAKTTVTLKLKRTLKQARKVTLRVTADGGNTVTKRFTLQPAKPAKVKASAAPKRVVAIEWDTVENLHMLGMAPVGAADMKGYDTWVAAPRPRGMKDVGSRQSPSIERIAALEPDLIVVPDYRSTKNLAQLKKIAPVLVTHPYPASGSQLNAMVTDFRRLATAVGRKARGERVLQDLSNTLARAKAKLKKGGRAGATVAIATPGGTSSAPAIRMFTQNSQTADVVRRLGLRDGWSGTARYGFATVGLEALSRVDGWLAFVYPPQFQRQVQGITKSSAYKRLPVVKAKRVRTLGGTTWLFGGPRSTMLFADRLANSLTS
ncbi:ABC-type Fe3+-hydroxamate transport system substrate-binding protein [Solirubrobacter pauli]|uniref:ABC-type Fe3+-hydroxamate transport system substrate-binding protein n=1 Tax=Solirubrobacter pauli TaxID=166793 RepID=A0A660L5F8_9ACTN|nr:iron-siderophore ABC transporter substrate-binding protein [Solirubrobacter pauli]RKQ88119.1 ABC-type Fe3+-hydroxamate transport system substrate-binding protein [Solirubrobacter pauli]